MYQNQTKGIMNKIIFILLSKNKVNANFYYLYFKKEVYYKLYKNFFLFYLNLFLYSITLIFISLYLYLINLSKPKPPDLLLKFLFYLINYLCAVEG